jgi:hypothetical protein
MVGPDEAIPHLLKIAVEKHGLEKTASLVDAIIGAPVGGAAAYIAADEGNKEGAAKRGLIMGALLGFITGQQHVHDALQGKKSRMPHPIVVSAAGGAGTGLYYRTKPKSKKKQNMLEGLQ